MYSTYKILWVCEVCRNHVSGPSYHMDDLIFCTDNCRKSYANSKNLAIAQPLERQYVKNEKKKNRKKPSTKPIVIPTQKETKVQTSEPIDIVINKDEEEQDRKPVTSDLQDHMPHSLLFPGSIYSGTNVLSVVSAVIDNIKQPSFGSPTNEKNSPNGLTSHKSLTDLSDIEELV